MELDVAQLFVLALYGMAVSWAEERNGIFQSWEPSRKQWANGILTLLAPILVAIVSSVPQLAGAANNPETLVSYVLGLFGPAIFVWLSSQGFHHVDRILQRFGVNPYEEVDGGEVELIGEPSDYVKVESAIQLFNAGRAEVGPKPRTEPASGRVRKPEAKPKE